MSTTPSGIGTAPRKIDIAKQAIVALVQKYGSGLPLGYTTFSQPVGRQCTDGIDVLEEPAVDQIDALTASVNATMVDNGTNTGEAVAAVSADPKMHDPTRPGSYILLITDGEPTCAAAGSSEPDYTIGQLRVAATGGVQSFIVGFGALPVTDQMNLDAMAVAGGPVCVDPSCNGHKYYPAESADALAMAIDSVSRQIIGENSELCDDSCYGASPCPSGQICVAAACRPDPCANLTTCAPGDYCLTDGTSTGRCVHACVAGCKLGQLCVDGQCQDDPCASVACTPGQVCVGGACVIDPCLGKTCAAHLSCSGGSCVDDPCRYVRCPSGTSCVAGSGACVGPSTGPLHKRGASGCALAAAPPPVAALLVLLLFGALLRVRRVINSIKGGPR
jgi:hypothetical protein